MHESIPGATTTEYDASFDLAESSRKSSRFDMADLTPVVIATSHGAGLAVVLTDRNNPGVTTGRKPLLGAFISFLLVSGYKYIPIVTP